jgi:hypothetical protein
VAEGARLESVFRGNSNVGSNPTLSAIHSALLILYIANGYDSQHVHNLRKQKFFNSRPVLLFRIKPSAKSMAVFEFCDDCTAAFCRLRREIS